jgi:hypothetical protein
MPNPFEELGAKGFGAAKAAAAAVKGLTGVFSTIVKEHGEVTLLLERTKASDDPGKRLDLWSKIRVELMSHERAELEVLYPVFRDHPQTRSFADDHERESAALEEAIVDLDGVDTASDLWSTKLDSLIGLVKHHVDEEENHYFPEAVQVLGKDVSHELDGRFKARKEAAIEQLK